MMFEPFDVGEPLLEFGGGGRHVDVRFGLMNHGPVTGPDHGSIRLGIVGTGAAIAGLKNWLEQCETEIPGRKSRLTNLAIAFPGIGAESPFRCGFRVADDDTRRIPPLAIERIQQAKTMEAAIDLAADVFVSEIEAIEESSSRPDVILVALTADLIERLVNDTSVGDGEDVPDAGLQPRRRKTGVDFRDILKARALRCHTPLQIVWETTWNDDRTIKRKLATRSVRTNQDEATRAWNLFSGLFYKAGYTPWRLPRTDTQLDTSYIGISFFETGDRGSIQTSCAQMFDERGQGQILQGARPRTDHKGRNPYLAESDAYNLLSRSLEQFRKHHRQAPARVVLHKTSPFRDEERSGFKQALAEERIDDADFLWIKRNTSIRLHRSGRYPVLRGTSVKLGSEFVLMTKGSVPFYQTYPAEYAPRPLHVVHDYGSASAEELAREIMLLTNMNWNTTQFDGGQPITITASKEVARILRHMNSDNQRTYRYAYFT
ncbi:MULTISPECIES: argonaute/piwi family protein [unclassified Aureimonas]|uniref:argonaute/piwi family protein n=1 Tax=unclassified Aureimonas TaxID=2615206 RepID=UPI0006FFB3E0|nr:MULTISPECIES: hypothetical protein [unclassified Aureimonas]KQT62271.1 hypothetical protein ASG62_23340 [Aureimonas sp. Leaf427]KQT72493.1 hypothetical protein ASG54_18225 [Aureimonas sp. Leaf460]